MGEWNCLGCKEKDKASAHKINKLCVKKKQKKKKAIKGNVCWCNKVKRKWKWKASCIKKDHLDKSRICALLESKPLNPRKNNEFL